MINTAWLRRIADEVEAKPSRRTTGASARFADGTPCDPRHPNAASWCPLGFAHRDEINKYRAGMDLARILGAGFCNRNDMIECPKYFVGWLRECADMIDRVI